MEFYSLNTECNLSGKKMLRLINAQTSDNDIQLPTANCWPWTNTWLNTTQYIAYALVPYFLPFYSHDISNETANIPIK